MQCALPSVLQMQILASILAWILASILAQGAGQNLFAAKNDNTLPTNHEIYKYLHPLSGVAKHNIQAISQTPTVGPAAAAARKTSFTTIAGVSALFMANRSDRLVIRFFPERLALSIRRRFPLT